MPRFDPNSYIDCQERINRFWGEYPEGRIQTELMSLPDEFERVVFRASVYKALTDSVPAATGWAAEVAGGGGANQTSWHENCECVPLSAEMLTRDGWKRAPDLRIGEDVLAYDVAADETRWTALRKVTVYPSAALVSMHNQHGFSVRCTPDHTWVAFGGNSRTKRRHLRRAAALVRNDAIVVAAPGPDGVHPLMPAEAAVLGWIITDGSIRRRGNHVRAQIGQTKPAGVAAIRALVDGIATEYVSKERMRTFPTGRTYTTKPGHKWDLPATFTRELLAKAGVSGKADLPALVTRLSAEARAAMLAAMMMAEASGSIFYQNPGPVLDAFQILATLEGKALGAARPTTHGDTLAQTVRRYRTVCRSQLTMEPAGNAPVWCPTTDHGTWVMRQGGVISITGNTSAIGRALANLGYATTREDRPSRQEMGKVARVEARRAAAPPRQPAARSGPGIAPEQAQRPVAVGVRAAGAPTISEKQVKYLYVLAGQAGMDDGALHEWLAARLGRTPEDVHVPELTKQEASDVIEALQSGATAAPPKQSASAKRETRQPVMAGMPEEPAYLAGAPDPWTA